MIELLRNMAVHYGWQTKAERPDKPYWLFAATEHEGALFVTLHVGPAWLLLATFK